MNNYNLTNESAANVMNTVGLNWGVEKKPIMVAGGKKIPGQFAMVRNDTQDVLGVVSSAFHPLQNAESFKWFDPFVEAGEASYATAGCFRGGKIVWILAKLNRDPSAIVPGDDVEKYVLLSNRHDGHGAISAGFTPVRVVCQNTLNMALQSAASKLLKVRHSRHMVADLETLRETMDLVNADFEATADQYRRLAATSISDTQLRAYFADVFDIHLPEASTRQTNLLNHLGELHEGGKGADYSRGTVWGAYNAATEYLTHERGQSEESRLASLYMGQSAQIGERALQYAYQLVA